MQLEMRRRVSSAGAVVDSDIGDEAAGEQRSVMAHQAVQARAAHQATLQQQVAAHFETIAQPHPNLNPN